MECRYCNRVAKNLKSHVTHERCCVFNPDRKYKNGMTGRKAWNKGLTKETNESVLKGSNSLKASYKEGNVDISYRDDPSFIKKCSERAKRLNFGGYRKNAGRSKKVKCIDSFGNEVCLQSSYELKCAEILNKLNINWIRPEFLFYNGKRYFPDFLLVGHNIYLDPKNDHLAKIDKDKIDLVCEQNNVKVFILTKDKISEEYILDLIKNNTTDA